MAKQTQTQNQEPGSVGLDSEPLSPFKYTNRVQLKSLLERSDRGAELVGQTVVVGGWVKSSKEVEKSSPPSPMTTDDETQTKDVSCVEILQSRILLIRNILDVFGGSGYVAHKKQCDFASPKPLPPKSSTAYLLLTDGSCVATLQVFAMASKRILKELKDLQKDPPTSCNAVLGKVKDFLGVMSEANKRLEDDSKYHPEKYDIEELTGNESEVIEMDLMLGVADLHTPEAVAAAELAISSCQPMISFAGDSSESESEEDSSTDDEIGRNIDECVDGKDGEKPLPPVQKPIFAKDNINEKQKVNRHSKKRPRIVELS